MKIGIVGAGFAARFHLAAWRRVHSVPVEIAGIASRGREKAEAFAAGCGVKAFGSVPDLLAQCDVLDVCTPGSTHEQYAVAALNAGKYVVLEKPFTGYYPASGDRMGAHPRPFTPEAFEEVRASCRRIREAAGRARRFVCYAENWIYAPTVQKEREIIQRTDAQVLRSLGEESHSGSHAPSYGYWSQAGGGALAGKGCHPLSAALYFKIVEGRARTGVPIAPASVSANVHRLTQIPGFRDTGFLRTDYHDTEDFSQMHITFTDGTVADIFASDVVLGGVSNWIEVFANNHRTRCMLNPIDALETFAPGADTLRDVYVTEKLSPKQGWMFPAPDEDWMHGYPQEMQAFAEAIAGNRRPESNGFLGEACMIVIYAAYLSATNAGRAVEIPSLTDPQY
jgi:predicted dehydrogenase